MSGAVILGCGHYVFILFSMHLVIPMGTDPTCGKKDEKVDDLTGNNQTGFAGLPDSLPLEVSSGFCFSAPEFTHLAHIFFTHSVYCCPLEPQFWTLQLFPFFCAFTVASLSIHSLCSCSSSLAIRPWILWLTHLPCLLVSLSSCS